MWQFEKGEDTIRLFLSRYALNDMFQDKRVLDLGCGAAGKSLYYASQGAKHVTGVEIVPHYQAEAEALPCNWACPIGLRLSMQVH